MSYRVMFTTNVDKNLLKRLYRLSIAMKVRLNVLLEQAIMDYLEKHDPKSKGDSSHYSVQ
jgi:predicted transcriptional regulator